MSEPQVSIFAENDNLYVYSQRDGVQTNIK